MTAAGERSEVRDTRSTIWDVPMTRTVPVPKVRVMVRGHTLVQRKHVDLCVVASALCR